MRFAKTLAVLLNLVVPCLHQLVDRICSLQYSRFPSFHAVVLWYSLSVSSFWFNQAPVIIKFVAPLRLHVPCLHIFCADPAKLPWGLRKQMAIAMLHGFMGNDLGMDAICIIQQMHAVMH